MGTKLNPGANDAWEKSEPDEPRFAFLGRDALAPGIIRLWCALIACDFNRAKDIFALLCATASKRQYRPGKDSSHVVEGRECANMMDMWRKIKNPRPKDQRAVISDLDLDQPVEGLIENASE